MSGSVNSKTPPLPPDQCGSACCVVSTALRVSGLKLFAKWRELCRCTSSWVWINTVLPEGEGCVTQSLVVQHKALLRLEASCSERSRERGARTFPGGGMCQPRPRAVTAGHAAKPGWSLPPTPARFGIGSGHGVTRDRHPPVLRVAWHRTVAVDPLTRSRVAGCGGIPAARAIPATRAPQLAETPALRPEEGAVPLWAVASPLSSPALPPSLRASPPSFGAAALPPPAGDIPGPSPAGGGPMEVGMLCGLRAGWGRRRAADAAGPGPRSLGGEPRAEAGGAGARCGGGWDAPAGRLWGQIASRGEAAEWGPGRRPPGSAMAAQCDPLSGYLPQPLSDPGSNSERSADSPAPGSEEDSAGPPRPLHSPEWGEERFRVDRKKLEAMLQGEGGSGGGARGARGGGGGREGREGAPARRRALSRLPLPLRNGSPVLSAPSPSAGRGPGSEGAPWAGPGCRGLSGRGCSRSAGASGSLCPRSGAERPGPIARVARCRLEPGRPRRRGWCRSPALPGAATRRVPVPGNSVCENVTSGPGRAMRALGFRGTAGREALEPGVPAGAAGTAPQS